MITMMLSVPNPVDATSFYRGFGPLGRLKRQVKNLSFVIAPDPEWSSMNMVDLIFMQRPYSAAHLSQIRRAKQMRIPLWVDYDDDLFCVPADNPAHVLYAKEEVKRNIAEICATADVVTVSTKFLANKLARLNGNIVVVPNAVDEKMFDREIDRKKQKKTIVWRGSATHQRDLAFYSEAILMVAQENPGWHWTFVGWNPWFITEAMGPNQCSVAPTVNIMEYFKFIQTIQAQVAIVPLYSCEFNMSKSNIAWIEGSMAGSNCLVPSWDEWKKPGAVGYENQEDFYKNLSKMLAKDFDRFGNAEASWKHIESELTLTEVNKQRHLILRDLVGSRAEWRE